MNRLLVPAFALLTTAGLASASTVTCPAPPNGGVRPNAVGIRLECGGADFSNFKFASAGTRSWNGGDENRWGSAGGHFNQGFGNSAGFHEGNGRNDDRGESHGHDLEGGDDRGHNSNGDDGGHDGRDDNGHVGNGGTPPPPPIVPPMGGGGSGDPASNVPEPASMILIGSGFVAVALLRRGSRKS